MGLITGLLTLPLAPVRGVVRLAEMLEDEARRQWSDPAAVRRELAVAETAHANGEISTAEYERIADELVARLLAGRSGGGP